MANVNKKFTLHKEKMGQNLLFSFQQLFQISLKASISSRQVSPNLKKKKKKKKTLVRSCCSVISGCEILRGSEARELRSLTSVVHAPPVAISTHQAQ
jgi:hypothetical protein